MNMNLTHIKYNIRFAITYLPALTFSLNTEMSILPSDSFITCLDFLLLYSTGVFQALQLIVLAVFAAVD